MMLLGAADDAQTLIMRPSTICKPSGRQSPVRRTTAGGLCCIRMSAASARTIQPVYCSRRSSAALDGRHFAVAVSSAVRPRQCMVQQIAAKIYDQLPTSLQTRSSISSSSSSSQTIDSNLNIAPAVSSGRLLACIFDHYPYGWDIMHHLRL